MNGKKLKTSTPPRKKDLAQSIEDHTGVLFEQSKKTALRLAELHQEIDRMLSSGPQLQAVVKVYQELKLTYEHMDTVRKVLLALKERFQYGVVPFAFEREGIAGTSFTELNCRISITDGMRVYMVDSEKGKEFLKKTGNKDIVQETVNASTLKAWFVEELSEGREPPEELFKSTPYKNTSLTKLKKKG